QRAQLFAAGAAVLVEAVEIELERFRFDQVRRLGRYAEFADRHAGLATRIQPGQFVGIPDVDATERQGAAEAELLAFRCARDRKQQARLVVRTRTDALAERRVQSGRVH